MRHLAVWVCLVGLWQAASGADYVSHRSGDWSDPATWGGAGIPRSGDAFVVESGHRITVSDGAAPILLCFRAGVIRKGGSLEIDYASNGHKQVNLAIDAGGGLTIDGGSVSVVGNPAGRRQPETMNRVCTAGPEAGKNAYLLLTGGARGRFRGVSFESLGRNSPQQYGLSVYSCIGSAGAPALEMDDCIVSGGYYGVGVLMSEGIKIKDCLFEDCTYSVFLHDVRCLKMDGCVLRKATAHLFMGGAQLGLRDSAISKCRFETASGYAVFATCGLPGSHLADAAFSNNAIDVFLAGDGVVELYNADFKSCVVDNPRKSGVISRSHGGADSDAIYIAGMYLVPANETAVWGGGRPFWPGGAPHERVDVRFSPIGSTLIVPAGASLTVTGTADRRSSMAIEKGRRTWRLAHPGRVKASYTDIRDVVLDPEKPIEADNATVVEGEIADD